MNERQLSTYCGFDWMEIRGIDDYGQEIFETGNVSHIDWVSNIVEEVYVPNVPPSKITGLDASQNENNYKKHIWGDYEPKGTVLVTMKDGTVKKGIANSFALKTSRVEKRCGSNECLYVGMDYCHEDLNYGLSDMVPFLEMMQIDSFEDGFRITDENEDEKIIVLPQDSEFWFIGEDSKFEPTKIKTDEVQKVVFIRRDDSGIDVKFCNVCTDDGSFKSPIAFISILQDDGIMRYHHDFTKYADFPVKNSNILKLEVVEQGSDGGMFSPPKGMKFLAYLKNGEDIPFAMDGYFSINVMSKLGKINQLSRNKLRFIDFNNIG